MKKITILFAFILFYSCDKNSDNQDIKQSFTTIKAREWYYFKFKESTEWKENNESNNDALDWSNGEYSKLDGSEVIEFPLIDKNTTSEGSLNISAVKKSAPLVRIAFIKTSNDSIIIRKRYYLPELNYLKKKQYDISSVELGNNRSDFTGLLITKKWNNEELSYVNIVNHTMTELPMPSVFKNRQTTKTNKATSKATTDPEPIVWYIQLGTCYVKRSSNSSVFWYFNSSTNVNELYKDTFFNYNTYQYNSYYYPLSGPNTSTSTVSIAQSIENSITTNLDPCAVSVLAKLKNTANCDVAFIFTAFGASTKLKLKINTGIPPNPTAAAGTVRTDSKIAFEYTTTINKDFTNSTQLFKAAVILHELVHAYFMSLKDNYSIDHEFAVFQNTSVLFQAFVEKNYPGTSFDAHHEQMANSYVNIIGSALQEFQTGKPVPGGIPDSIYIDLAWAGLRETPIYDKTFPKGSVERDRIEKEYGAESVGRDSGGYYPIGTKCN